MKNEQHNACIQCISVLLLESFRTVGEAHWLEQTRKYINATKIPFAL